MSCRILTGDCLEVLRTLPEASVNCCVCSPPYWGLRDYGCAGQIGLEATPELYTAALVAVFAEVRRVLRDEGTLWLNLGDCYANSDKGGYCKSRVTSTDSMQKSNLAANFIGGSNRNWDGLPPKNLVGIPWRVAFALQADGWYLRSEIIWCLSGGTRLYAKTANCTAPYTLHDLVRLDPKTVKLWNGEKWTQVLGWSQSPIRDSLCLELRSGERINCTYGHQFPTERGLLRANEIRIGDVLKTCVLPDQTAYQPEMLRAAVNAFIVGLYMAEGSRSGDTIQFSLNADEAWIAQRINEWANRNGGSCHWHEYGKNLQVCAEGKILNAILDTYITGNGAKEKRFTTAFWERDNDFLRQALEGYLEGDAHYDKPNERWRLGFTRNYFLASDLRTICARLGFGFRLKPSTARIGGKTYDTYKGELRKTKSGHHNEKSDSEVVAITPSKGRQFWDVGVEDEPHLFALASGVLSHNSKPNPMPESVTDRPTKSHEQIFLLAKSQRYYYDAEAIREQAAIRDDERPFGCRDSGDHGQGERLYSPRKEGPNSRIFVSRDPQHEREYEGKNRNDTNGANGRRLLKSVAAARDNGGDHDSPFGQTRNKRSVWTVATTPYADAHFATFPPDLIKPCILAGCPVGGTVLDPFGGSGTTGMVATELGRKSVLIELNPDYVRLADIRTNVTPGLALA